MLKSRTDSGSEAKGTRGKKAAFTLAEGATHLAMPPVFSKAGFTLAEVLITLGIIGVVAAMTIPNLISNYSKHIVESNLKETYSILQQTLKFTEYDDVSFEMELPDNMESSKKWFETYLAPHMKYSTVCYNKSGCWNDKGLTRTLSGGVPYTYRSQIGIGSDIIIIKLTNGSNLIVDGYSAGSIYNYFGVRYLIHLLLYYSLMQMEIDRLILSGKIFMLLFLHLTG